MRLSASAAYPNKVGETKPWSMLSFIHWEIFQSWPFSVFSERTPNWECGCGISSPSGGVATYVYDRSSVSFAGKLTTLMVLLNSPSLPSCKVNADCIGSNSCCLATLPFFWFCKFHLKPQTHKVLQCWWKQSLVSINPGCLKEIIKNDTKLLRDQASGEVENHCHWPSVPWWWVKMHPKSCSGIPLWNGLNCCQ